MLIRLLWEGMKLPRKVDTGPRVSYAGEDCENHRLHHGSLQGTESVLQLKPPHLAPSTRAPVVSTWEEHVWFSFLTCHLSSWDLEKAIIYQIPDGYVD